jgi:hypothetical protein
MGNRLAALEVVRWRTANQGATAPNTGLSYVPDGLVDDASVSRTWWAKATAQRRKCRDYGAASMKEEAGGRNVVARGRGQEAHGAGVMIIMMAVDDEDERRCCWIERARRARHAVPSLFTSQPDTH